MEAEIKSYTFRPYVQDDVNFIQSSWGHSYYSGSSYKDLLAPKEFHERHRPIRDRILARPNVAIIVCVSKEYPDTILGWILVEKPPAPPDGFRGIFLHYLYVKEAFKKEHIATELIDLVATPSKLVLYTHITEQAGRIMGELRMKDKASNRKDRFEHFYYEPHLI